MAKRDFTLDYLAKLQVEAQHQTGILTGILSQLTKTAPVAQAAQLPVAQFARTGSPLEKAFGGGAGAPGGGSGLGSLLAVGGVAVALGAFVRAASPGTMERLGLAFHDLAGTVGQTLVPVFEQVLIPAIRLFGDLLMTILPGSGEMADALQPVADFLGDLRDALAPLAPIIHDVLVVGLKALGVALQVLLIPVRALLEFISGLFGGGGGALKNSVGAGFRGISFQSPDQYAHQVYAAAFKAGMTQPRGPVDKISETLDQVLVVLQSIAAKLGAAKEAGRDVGNFFQKAFTEEGRRELWPETFGAPRVRGGEDADKQAKRFGDLSRMFTFAAVHPADFANVVLAGAGNPQNQRQILDQNRRGGALEYLLGFQGPAAQVRSYAGDVLLGAHMAQFEKVNEARRRALDGFGSTGFGWFGGMLGG